MAWTRDNPFKMRGSYIGGLLLFIMPWILFFILNIYCSMNQQTDCRCAVALYFGLTVLFSLMGLIVGFFIGWEISEYIKKSKKKV